MGLFVVEVSMVKMFGGTSLVGVVAVRAYTIKRPSH